MENDMDSEEWDFWESIGITCGGYSSDSDENLIRVFIETSKEDHWYANIAQRLNLDAHYVSLLMEILASAGFCEYGTSPRGAWAAHQDYEANVEKLKAWFKAKWSKEFK